MPAKLIVAYVVRCLRQPSSQCLVLKVVAESHLQIWVYLKEAVEIDSQMLDATVLKSMSPRSTEAEYNQCIRLASCVVPGRTCKPCQVAE